MISSLAIHLTSCMWLYQAIFINEDENGGEENITWLTINGEDTVYDDYFYGYNPTRQYVVSLYYTTVISYGNMHAHNDTERIMSLVIMSLGGMLMTYSI